MNLLRFAILVIAFTIILLSYIVYQQQIMINELFGEWHAHKLTEVSLDQQQNLEKLLSDKGFHMKDWCAERGLMEL